MIGILGIFGGPKAWMRDLAWAASVSLLLACIGPFGSFEALHFAQRVSLCLAIGLSSAIVFSPGTRAAMQLSDRFGLPVWFAVSASALVVSIPITGVVRIVERLLMGAAWPLPPLSTHYFFVLCIVLPLMGIRVALTRRWTATPMEAIPPPMPRGASRLACRLPPKLRGDIIALQAEDHYVRVHTTAGSTLLLMRIADAIDELDNAEGLKVHRSWWVARAAVSGMIRDGRRMRLELPNGLNVPVTREMVPHIRRSGWLQNA
jgi:hypothetical protein